MLRRRRALFIGRGAWRGGNAAGSPVGGRHGLPMKRVDLMLYREILFSTQVCGVTVFVKYRVVLQTCMGSRLVVSRRQDMECQVCI